MIFKDEFLSFISQTNEDKRVFLTLGPEGTSSKQATDALSAVFPAQVRLYPTYENAAEAIATDPTNRALIVANAYAAINRFYISNALIPVAAFFHDTPAYVIATRCERALGQDTLTVASHPAPRHLIDDALNRPGLSVVEADSTHSAAEFVVNGLADACLTTQVAAHMLGLETVTTALPTIPMLWTIFISKDHEEWRQKALLCCPKPCPSASKPTSQP